METHLFCPRCGAQNKVEQKFCRQCGLALPGVRLALGARLDEAAADLKKAEDDLGSAALTLGIFVLAALVNWFLWDWGVLINLVLGLLITFRWVLRGLKQLEGVRTLLDARDAASRAPALPTAEPAPTALPPAPDTDPLTVAPQSSIAEHTTFSLKQPRQK